MKFKIHWTYKGFEDSVIIEGENIEEILEEKDRVEESRGLNPVENNMWSEEIK